MKTTRLLAILAIGLAVILTAVGGTLDMWRGDAARGEARLVLTSQHAWNDGIFLLLLAIALLLI